MKFKIKKSYKVMGSRIRVKIVEMYDAGLYDHDKKIILINEMLSEEERVKTLLHELIHCLQYHTGIHQAVSRELLEVMSETGSQCFFDIFIY